MCLFCYHSLKRINNYYKIIFFDRYINSFKDLKVTSNRIKIQHLTSKFLEEKREQREIYWVSRKREWGKSPRNVKNDTYDQMVEVSTNVSVFQLNMNSFNSPFKIQNPTRGFFFFSTRGF